MTADAFPRPTLVICCPCSQFCMAPLLTIDILSIDVRHNDDGNKRSSHNNERGSDKTHADN